MVEISLSGSGEGPGWETSRPTLQRPFPPTARAHPVAPPRHRTLPQPWPDASPTLRRAAGRAPCRPHAGHRTA